MKILKTAFYFLALNLGMPAPLFALTTYGYLERVTVFPGELSLKAKLDTGAKSASLNAKHIKIIKRGGRKWVRFDVPQDNETLRFETRLIRYVSIKTRHGEKKMNQTGDSFKRPVVMMQMALGGKMEEVEVNLANRERFNYPLLLGRSALIKFEALINPALKFTIKRKEK